MEQLKNKSEVFLIYQKQEKHSLQIMSYSYASFSANNYRTSQLGYLIFLSDKWSNWQPSIGSLQKQNGLQDPLLKVN